MNRDSAVDMVMRRLGGRKEASNTVRNHIISEMVDIITDTLEQEPILPWFLLEEKTITTTIAQDYVELDAAFLQTWEEGGFFLQLSDGTEKELFIDDWDVVREKFITATGTDLNNEPRFGSVIGTRLYMRPIPDAAYNIKYWQYGKDDAVSITGTYGDGNSSAENLWLKYASDVVSSEAGAIVASLIVKDEKAANNFVALLTRARNRLTAKDLEMKEQLKQRFMESE